MKWRRALQDYCGRLSISNVSRKLALLDYVTQGAHPALYSRAAGYDDTVALSETDNPSANRDVLEKEVGLLECSTDDERVAAAALAAKIKALAA